MMQIKYYAIDEKMAKIAHEMNSYFEFVDGATTNNYQRAVCEIYKIGEERIKKYPEQAERIEKLCGYFSVKLAEWYNKHFRIEAMCPSMMISGGGNFNVQKKQKQNEARERHNEEWKRIWAIRDKVEHAGTAAIMSDDEDAVEKLELRITKLVAEQEKMKAINAYWRINKTLKGCPHLTWEQAEEAEARMRADFTLSDAPYPKWALSNNNANIRRLKERLEKIKQEKVTGTREHSEEDLEIDGLKIVENVEAMRIQLIFDGKPDEETRAMLKHNGFHWSPRFTAWQRELNDNGKHAAAKVIEQLREKEKCEL